MNEQDRDNPHAADTAEGVDQGVSARDRFQGRQTEWIGASGGYAERQLADHALEHADPQDLDPGRAAAFLLLHAALIAGGPAFIRDIRLVIDTADT